MHDLNIITLFTPKSEIVYISENQSIRQAVERMRAHSYTAVPVLSLDGAYLGTVCEGDFLYYLIDHGFSKESFEDCNICELIDRNRYHSITVRSSMEEVLLRVLKANFVPVLDDRGLFMGIITRRDVLNYTRRVNPRFLQFGALKSQSSKRSIK
ncbi:MAG: CBS domain-containing protein [Eubacteriales bacterium]|nr:CBS domain-containing protein [Eubacteriales bacterium]